MKYPFSHKAPYRVRYFDTDKMGVMWHGHYIQLFEIGRTEAMRSAGFCYDDLEKSGTMMPIVECGAKYLRPAKYDELLSIETLVREKPGATMRFDFVIRGPDGAIDATGFATLAFIDAVTRRPCRPPRALRLAEARET